MALLDVDGLSVSLPGAAGPLLAVDDISFSMEGGRVTCIVGESGCGKSTTALALIRLLAERASMTGRVQFEGRNLLGLTEAQMCGIRGNRISMVFQEPMTALNPVKTIGEQVTAPLRIHARLGADEAYREAVGLLQRVGVDEPARRLAAYPHQLSGGQRQRVVIAMALACKPDIIIADEPTTALDTTVQRQILDLLLGLVDETSTALLLITHNLAIVSEVADKVLVMYGGRIIESGSAEQVFSRPLHPYTQGLMRALPRIDMPLDERIVSIPGTVPSLSSLPAGCAFYERCGIAADACRRVRPAEKAMADRRTVACIRVEEAV